MIKKLRRTRLKEYRKKFKFTQKEIATILNISASSVGDIENNIAPLKEKYAEILVELFKLESVDDLYLDKY